MSTTHGALVRRRTLVAIIAGLAVALVATGCGTSSGGQTASPTTRLPSWLHHLFPGFELRYGGTARLKSTPPPRSSALPGANDLLAADGGVLAATGQGIFRSTDGGVSWQQVLSGVNASSLASVQSGGYAALGTLPATSGNGPAVLATSRDGAHWMVRRVTTPANLPLPLSPLPVRAERDGANRRGNRGSRWCLDFRHGTPAAQHRRGAQVDRHPLLGLGLPARWCHDRRRDHARRRVRDRTGAWRELCGCGLSLGRRRGYVGAAAWLLPALPADGCPVR